MTILFGHPSGSPFSHNAALAHFEAGRLEAFCVPWMPSEAALRRFCSVAPLRPMAERLARRRFPALSAAPKVQGRVGEWRRLALRAAGRGDERLSYEANDWLMATMAREVRRPRVTAVHAYEDCSMEQFVEAKRLGKVCIYDMPIGYYPAWEQIQAELAHKFRDWLPATGLPSQRFARPEQKRQEMELADLVLVPSVFVEETVRRFHPDKLISRASYGVDIDFWTPSEERRSEKPLHFLYVGQLSVRKGTPLLIEAWAAAGLRDAHLSLVGSWQLAEGKKRELPPNITWTAPVSAVGLRQFYQVADVFVFPTFFEGRALAVGEAMAVGLPILSTAACGFDVLCLACGRIVPVGDKDALTEELRRFAGHRDELPAMSRAARASAELLTWRRYREQVSEAVAPLV